MVVLAYRGENCPGGGADLNRRRLVICSPRLEGEGDGERDSIPLPSSAASPNDRPRGMPGARVASAGMPRGGVKMSKVRGPA